MGKGRKLFVAFALVALGAVGFATPAHAGNASPQQVTDPAGDGRGRGDIRAVRVAHYGGPLVLQVRTEQGVNLIAAPSWSSSTSKTRLRFFVRSAGIPDFSIIIRATGEGPVGSLNGIEMAPRGDCVTVTQPQPTIIRASVGMACMPGISAAAVFARYRFDERGDGTINSIDRGPDEGTVPIIDIVD
jgi:hypothetical protein